MDGPRAIVLALLICLAPLGGLSVAADDASGGTDGGEPGMTVVNETRTAGYLAPAHQDVDSTGQWTATLDVAGSVGSDAGEVRASHTQASLERAYWATGDETERRAIVAQGIQDLSADIDRLEQRETQTIDRYDDGAIDEAELFRSLSAIHREANAMLSTVDWLEESANTLEMDVEVDWLATERVRLLRHQGPAREQLDEALRGEDHVRAHVDTSDQGLVIATVDVTDGSPTYVREAYNPSARTIDTADQYGGNPNLALERVEELYPWVLENNRGFDANVIGTEGVRTYRIRIAHPHGELEAHLDGGSTDILREVQAKNPELVPATTVETIEGGLRMQVNATRAGGPLGISVVDGDERVDADVEINGDAVGSTGGEQLWTIAPRGDVTINATYAGDTVTLEERFE